MSTFLFVVPPLAGHITPLVAVADRLHDRGHRVVWSGEESIVRRLAGPDAEIHPCLAGPVDVDVRGAELRGYAGVRFLWEEFLVPLAEVTYPAVVEAAVRSGADVLVCDMQALAGPLAAARLGRPWATSATTSGPLRDTFAATPKVQRWFDDLLDGLIARTTTTTGTTATAGIAGIAGTTNTARTAITAGTARTGGPTRPGPATVSGPPTPRTLRLSPHLVLAFTTQALAGPPGGDSLIGPDGPPTAWVGPSLPPRADPVGGDLDGPQQDGPQADRPKASNARPGDAKPDSTKPDSTKPGNAKPGDAKPDSAAASEAFPWGRLDPGRRLVVTSLGTVNGQVSGEFLRTCAAALRTLGDGVQAVIADPLGAVDPAAMPDGGIAARFLPLVDLLPRAAAVVCHAGHNTVCEALGHGVPLVVAPIRDDQPVIAQQVVDAGAGIRLRFARATPAIVASAVREVLDDPRYRSAAARVGA
ncbi:glycosyltransferase, partial [Frankia sp. AiPs1]|uniref:glycosyltransferase n=1 Tax=Frankia sp. AiPs1 TaxID=573493 RepID=UPI002043C936